MDLRRSLKWCDLGDVFAIANIEKGFDQISKTVAHVRSEWRVSIMLGGDHSIGYPDVFTGIAPYIDGPVGIIHIDRHVDTQETDMDERMHIVPVVHDEHSERAARGSRATRHRRLAAPRPA